MLIRFPVEGRLDWCVRTHVSTQIGEDNISGPVCWTRSGVFSRDMTDDEIMPFLDVPPDLQEMTVLYQGETVSPVTKEKVRKLIKLSEEEKAERRKQYHHEYYWRKKYGG